MFACLIVFFPNIFVLFINSISNNIFLFQQILRLQAGIVNDLNDNLMIVVESESASVYIHHLLRDQKLDAPITEFPRKYLVIDLGGTFVYCMQ